MLISKNTIKNIKGFVITFNMLVQNGKNGILLCSARAYKKRTTVVFLRYATRGITPLASLSKNPCTLHKIFKRNKSIFSVVKTEENAIYSGGKPLESHLTSHKLLRHNEKNVLLGCFTTKSKNFSQHISQKKLDGSFGKTPEKGQFISKFISPKHAEINAIKKIDEDQAYVDEFEEKILQLNLHDIENKNIQVIIDKENSQNFNENGTKINEYDERGYKIDNDE